MAAQAIACAVGLWLMAAPGVLNYDGAPRLNDQILGPLAASFACVAMWQVTRSVRWANVALGSWLILAPLFLRHGPAAAINSVLSGLVLAEASLVRGRLPHRMGGGWKSLFGKSGG